jgi:multidrug efflux pump subunit AcrA (membrane-fusion protein)
MVAGADGLAHQQAVKVGIRNGDDVQILEGISANEKVVTNGAYGLPDKTKIKVEASEAPAKVSKPSADAGTAPGEESSDK